MFFAKNREKKTRKEAAECLHNARKIHAYRHDILPEKDREILENAIKRLESLLKDKTSPVEGLKRVQAEAEKIMARTGGSFYPKTFLADNAEMLIFAAILAIGIRTFFLQPFKIPTNSMYPTYNGMTAEVFMEDSAPNPLMRAFRFLTLGTSHFSLVAPEQGELSYSTERQVVPGRKWFVLPTQKVRHTFYIGQSPVEVDLPLDFDIRQVLDPVLNNGEVSMARLSNGARVLRTGLQVDKGETALSFDILTGDQLFVDRFSYHFLRPKVGDPIVFRTENLEHIGREEQGKYYIKRAVAGPGDILQIDPPGLLLNGKEITGARAFEKNRNREAPYTGYVFVESSTNYALPFKDGRQPITIPEGHYFAMGDNSPNSADSRMWGFIPQTEIVGRARFIYYPFSHRWGIAR